MTFDPNKPYTYRDGTPARIICINNVGDYPIVSADKDGGIFSHLEDGNLWEGAGNSQDLINPPVKKTIYVNVYLPYKLNAHLTFAGAKNHAGEAAIAVGVPFTFEEGYGL